ncbi:MAG: SMP-30/gluconolactonase/LRE family protein [Roseovarius indicus]
MTETATGEAGFDPASFRLTPGDFTFLGENIQRPECVVALSDGSVLASDCHAVVARVGADGRQERVGGGVGLPNTFALDGAGNLFVTDLERRTVVKCDAAGASVMLDAFEGGPIGAVNYILGGEAPGEFWLTVSTQLPNLWDAISEPRPDGRILRLEGGNARLVADGLYFPNAMQINTETRELYVAETTAGAVARAKINEGGTLGPMERFGPEPVYEGAFLDGLAIDVDGNVWLTELARNAILVIDPAGHMHTVFEDPEGETLKKPTDLAFGGPDGRTVFVGSLKMKTIPSFRAPVAGMPQWHQRRQVTLNAGIDRSEMTGG